MVTSIRIPAHFFAHTSVYMANYKLLAAKRDRDYERIMYATRLVRDFVVRRGLILYGGTALHFALLAKGSGIYEFDKGEIPDLDFYSSNNVADAYDLAVELYQHGFEDAAATRAIHTGTMKVRALNGTPVADISYKPQELLDKIPKFYYSGTLGGAGSSGESNMRLVHPDFMRIDQHSAMAFPYDNAPMEVIFQRLKKDIKRFNLLNAAYPISAKYKADIAPPDLSGLPTDLPLTGRNAAALYLSGVTKSKLAAIRYDPAEFVAEFADVGVVSGERGPILPESAQVMAKKRPITYFTANQRLVAVQIIDGRLVASVPHVLMVLLAQYFTTGDADKLGMYCALLNTVVSFGDDCPDILMPGVETYGKENVNSVVRMSIMKTNEVVSGTKMPEMPENYYVIKHKNPDTGEWAPNYGIPPIIDWHE